jgi:hypothetical protein
MANETSGLRLRNSLTANAVSRTPDPARVRAVCHDPQPATGARTRLYTSSSMPPVTSTAPWESKVAALPPRSFERRNSAPTATPRVIGGFTKKIHLHPGP